MYPELMKVAPSTQTLSADQLLAKAMMAMPDASLSSTCPRGPGSERPVYRPPAGSGVDLFMDPASGACSAPRITSGTCRRWRRPCTPIC